MRAANAAGGTKRFRLTAPVRREFPLQEQIAKLLSIEIAPPGRLSRQGVVWWAQDIANYAGVPGARVARGIIAGVPDFFLCWHGRAHLIELKAEDGVLSDEQRMIAVTVIASHGRFAAVQSAEETLDVLDEWQIPRARRTTFQ